MHILKHVLRHSSAVVTELERWYRVSLQEMNVHISLQRGDRVECIAFILEDEIKDGNARASMWIEFYNERQKRD